MKQELEDLVREIRRRGTPYQEAVDEFRKTFISIVLRANNGNQSRSAKQLGVHRNTLNRAILAMRIDPRAMRQSVRRRPPQPELQIEPRKKERIP
ncbi:MAG TPA: helix-turn-helix domain-containing protein [Terriglobales bacterium]|nr:helix-turn-helix domain-containing protein [Terriglobales bacterium]